MGRNQETVSGAKTPKIQQQKTVNAETEEKMRKTYTKGVKSKRKTEDIIMLKTWRTGVSRKHNTVI